MPALPNVHTKYLEALRMLVPNSGRRFITEDMELLALNQAAIMVASKLGGISFVSILPL